MKESKKSREQPLDRLSELPDSLISEIFRLLPMRDVVRTTILSKRWKNLWTTTTPSLDFDCHTPEFVSRALNLWKGLKILKFKFSPDSDSVIDKSVFSDIDLWVRLCTENGVEEFYFEDSMDRYSSDDDPPNEVYGVPHCLFSCSSLKVLSLEGCNLLQNHVNVQWNQLRSLTIEGCIVDEDMVNQVVCGSPQLEVFFLDIVSSRNSLSIQSTSLKKLTMKRDFDDDDEDDDDDEPSTVTEMSICSPNLETLHLGGMPYDKYLLTNVSSLNDLTLDFGYETCEEDKFGEILWQIFPAVQHVEKLTISDWCIKVLLGAMKDKYSISPSSNLKSLTIKKEYAGDYEHIVDILQIFPELMTLVLQSSKCSYIPANYVGSFFHYERNLPESFLLQLRTVEITLTNVSDQIFPFIKILLKRASNLQKMAIRGPRVPKLKKVLTMPRSSPTADCRVYLADY